VWWADLPPPVGSGPGFRRPVVVVQGNQFNQSRVSTILCVPLTGNLRLGGLPGNVVLTNDSTGLPQDSVANVSQLFPVDRALFLERTGRVSDDQLQFIFHGIDFVLGR
jgi:mRNA interferase MazF